MDIAMVNLDSNNTAFLMTLTTKTSHYERSYTDIISKAYDNSSFQIATKTLLYADNSFDMQEFICAIKRNDLDAIKLLIENGDVNVRLTQRRTPLHYAASEQAYEALCLLLQNGAEVNAKDLYGRTPLHSGIYNTKIAIALLENGANLNAVDDFGWTPLHRAYQRCDMVLLRELAKEGASLNEFTPDGLNALHNALSHAPDRLDLIKFLIDEQKMNVNEFSKWHDGTSGAPTPFMCAIYSQRYLEENFELLNYLLKQGADFDVKIHHNGRVVCRSVLEWAEQHTTTPRYVIAWLIENGAR